MGKTPLDHLRSRKKQVYIDVPIPDDGSYLVARDEARSRVNQLELRARVGRDGKMDPATAVELEEAKEALEAAEEALKPHLIWFRVTSLPPKQYDKLVSQYPPTDQQRKEAKKAGVTALAYDTDKFLPALIVKCAAYAYRLDEDGEPTNAYPPFGDDVVFEPLSDEFLDEMQGEGNWAQGEVMILAEAAANVNQNIRRVGTLGNV